MEDYGRDQRVKKQVGGQTGRQGCDKKRHNSGKPKTIKIVLLACLSANT